MYQVYRPCIFAGKIQAIAETYGVFFSLTAVFIQMHSIASAVIFMTTYNHVFQFPSPLLAPQSGIWRSVTLLPMFCKRIVYCVLCSFNTFKEFLVQDPQCSITVAQHKYANWSQRLSVFCIFTLSKHYTWIPSCLIDAYFTLRIGQWSVSWTGKVGLF